MDWCPHQDIRWSHFSSITPWSVVSSSTWQSNLISIPTPINLLSVSIFFHSALMLLRWLGSMQSYLIKWLYGLLSADACTYMETLLWGVGIQHPGFSNRSYIKEIAIIPLFLIYIVYMKLCKSSKNWKIVLWLCNYFGHYGLCSLFSDTSMEAYHNTLHLDQVLTSFWSCICFLSTWPTISVWDHFSDKIFKQDGAMPHYALSYC